MCRHHLTETLGQLGILHVSSEYRRRGIATQFLGGVVRLAKASDATGLYVSATPSGSAIGFYRLVGFGVFRPHPALYALEREDIHMVKPL